MQLDPNWPNEMRVVLNWEDRKHHDVSRLKGKWRSLQKWGPWRDDVPSPCRARSPSSLESGFFVPLKSRLNQPMNA